MITRSAPSGYHFDPPEELLLSQLDPPDEFPDDESPQPEPPEECEEPEELPQLEPDDRLLFCAAALRASAAALLA